VAVVALGTSAHATGTGTDRVSIAVTTGDVDKIITVAQAVLPTLNAL